MQALGWCEDLSMSGLHNTLHNLLQRMVLMTPT